MVKVGRRITKSTKHFCRNVQVHYLDMMACLRLLYYTIKRRWWWEECLPQPSSIMNYVFFRSSRKSCLTVVVMVSDVLESRSSCINCRTFINTHHAGSVALAFVLWAFGSISLPHPPKILFGGVASAHGNIWRMANEIQSISTLACERSRAIVHPTLEWFVTYSSPETASRLWLGDRAREIATP
jgi:hypothetical protein